MKNDWLPIGSIVTVNGVDLMICGFFKKGTVIDGKTFDYACCPYPDGVKPEAVLIKKEDIQRVVFIGFQDARFAGLKHMLEK